MQPDTFYHVYNRGVNGETIFKQERNYTYFLQKYALYIEPIAQTFAYCLLNNHFHVLIRTRSEEEILANTGKPPLGTPKTTSWHLSNAFSSLFQSYAQSINKACNRTGALFEEPFLRKTIDSEPYFTNAVSYIHRNPQHHGFVRDFRDYQYSSYHSFLTEKPTQLQRKYVLEWFDGTDNYKMFHQMIVDMNDDWAIEL
jgi:REP element-mobilizing transposase RayT